MIFAPRAEGSRAEGTRNFFDKKLNPNFACTNKYTIFLIGFRGEAFG